MKPLRYERRDGMAYLVYLLYLGAVIGMRYFHVAAGMMPKIA